MPIIIIKKIYVVRWLKSKFMNFSQLKVKPNDIHSWGKAADQAKNQGGLTSGIVVSIR